MWYNTRNWQVLGLLLLLLLLPAPLQAEEVPSAQNPVYFPSVQGRTTYVYYVPTWFVPPLNKLGLSGGTPQQADALGANWLYDWTTHPDTRGEYVEAVPMVWGAWGDGSVPEVGGNSPWLMGFNEPDIAIQANLTPEHAARLWRQIEAAYPRKLLVSPAPSSEGRYWLVQMRLAYRELFDTWPRFDVLAAHCYQWTAAACDAVLRDYRAWVRDWQIPGGIWVTEFAFQRAWTPDPEREARTFVAMLEADPLVRRYAPFVAHTPRGVWYWPYTSPQADPSLFVGPQSLTLTDVGRWYAR